MTSPTAQPKSPEQRRAEFIAARNVYIAIIVSFLTVCITAVIITTKIEAEKPGFRAIETVKPMSFIDKTYMPKEKPVKSPATP